MLSALGGCGMVVKYPDGDSSLEWSVVKQWDYKVWDLEDVFSLLRRVSGPYEASVVKAFLVHFFCILLM